MKFVRVAFLAAQISMLRQRAERLDSILLYVSDHGESLGEQGLFLHGMPYAFAPDTQKQAPMMMWTSPGYRTRWQLDYECVRARGRDFLSHDNVYHTVPGALQITNAVYDEDFDFLSRCRGSQRS